MNQKVVDCTTNDYMRTFHKHMGRDEDVMELLWQNGNVIMNSQNHRKVPGLNSELKQVQKPSGNQSNLIQDDENAPWFQFPLDDPFDKDFSLEFLSDMLVGDGAFGVKNSKTVELDRQGHVKLDDTYDSSVLTTSCPQQFNQEENGITCSKVPDIVAGLNSPISMLKNDSALNFPHIPSLAKGKMASTSDQLSSGSECWTNKVRGQESSTMTIMSASNQIVTDLGPSRTLSSATPCVVAKGMQQDAGMVFHSERTENNNVDEFTVTTSSSGSDYSVERIRLKRSNQSHKRKARGSEDLGCQSEEADYESVEPKKAAKPRSRAAEVHNLAERRRRNRINEKMKALQELIPHCNKTDKASMLDEAIEYLKSLQMQVQMMWMGGGVSQMMFPGVQQYFSGIGMGLSHLTLPTIPTAAHAVASGSTTNQSLFCPSSGLNMLNFPTQMQRALQESYGCYLGLQQMQAQPQAVNFNAYGSPMLQQNHSLSGIQGALSEAFHES